MEGNMETVGNQFGESKGEEQARKADEALEFHHNGGPLVSAPRQSNVIKETMPTASEARVIASEDAIPRVKPADAAGGCSGVDQIVNYGGKA
jgi:hypothetical protein